MRLQTALISVLIALLTAFTQAQEKVNLRLNLAPGTSWTFAQNESMDLDTTVNSAGQLQQQAKQRGTRKMSGKAEVIESNNGTPTAIRFTFDKESGGMMDNGMGQQMPLPFALAGQTVTCRFGAGQFSHDFQGQIDDQTLTDLRSLVEQEQRLLPKQPVGVGDRWSPDINELARAWQLDPTKQKIGVGFELKEFTEVKGCKAAIAVLDISIAGELMPGLNGMRRLRGPVLIDVQTGRFLSADLNGSMELSGTQQMQGPNGMVEMSMQSRGPISTKVESSITQTAVGNAPTAGGTVGNPGPVNNPGGGGLPPFNGGDGAGGGASAPPATNNLAGTYQDNQLKLDLAESSGQYTGVITMGDQKLPVKASMQNGRLVGTFTSDGESFSFTAESDAAGGLKLTTGNTTYNLKKSEVKKNPLAR